LFGGKRHEIVVVMVVSGETRARLNPKHGRWDSQTLGDIRNPRNEGVADQTRDRPTFFLLFPDHLGKFFSAHELQLSHVGAEIVAVGAVEVPSVVKEFEPYHAPAQWGGLIVADVTGFADARARVFGCREGDEEAEIGEALA
jgi:hypothetical protein